MAGRRKVWWKSATLWALTLQLVGLLVAGFGSGRAATDLAGDVEVQRILGEIMTALGAAGVLWGRARAQGPLTLRRSARPEPLDEPEPPECDGCP